MKITKNNSYIKNIIPGQPTITMSMGNPKLDKSILIFNLPSIITCPNCELCKNDCYARKAEKQYPSVLPCRMENWEASKLDNFEIRMIKTITKVIKKYGVKSIRVHESGDFYSYNYAVKWQRIATNIKTFIDKDIIFFAYTKSPHRPLQGFNIVESILPDGNINFADKKTVYKLAKKHKARVCPYGLAY